MKNLDTQENKLERDDRVTINGAWANVLGTVKRVNDVGDAYVEFEARGFVHLGWFPVADLTLWR